MEPCGLVVTPEMGEPFGGGILSAMGLSRCNEGNREGESDVRTEDPGGGGSCRLIESVDDT